MEEGSGGSRESQPTPRKEEKIAGRGGWSAPENAVKLKNVLAKINENGLRISPAVPASVPSTNPTTKIEVLGASGNFYRFQRTNENVAHK